ncbi:MAG: hypothetical protein QOD86_1864, partial [Miltoncostaeaceae bacterium]|nr:hypothetical protein [Miltoncostaeaceae bacterium]
SVFVQAAGITDFVQAAAATAPGQAARYGGATGSYIHASIFLGTVGVLLLGLLVQATARGQAVLRAAALVTVVAAMFLTYGRAGLIIAAVGFAVLVVASPGRARRRLLAACLAGIALALPFAAISGRGPADVVDRAASSLDWSDDPGNRLRIREMRRALDRFAGLPLPQKVLGDGLAATGNARKLADLTPTATESYYLKLLIEVGVVGLLLAGGFLLWATAWLARTCLRAREDPVALTVAAAGFALSLDALVFPTLEVQLVALTWWGLLLAALVRRAAPAVEIALPSPAMSLTRRARELPARARVRSSVVAVAGAGVGAAGAFLAAIVAVRALDATEFAVFGVGLAIHSLAVQFADAGLGVVAVTETAEDWAAGERRRFFAKLAILLRRRLLIAVGVAAVLAAAAFIPGSFAPYRDVAVIAAGGAVFGTLPPFLAATLQGMHRFRAAAFVLGLVGVLRLLLACGLAIAGAGPAAHIAAYAVAATIAGSLLGLWLLRGARAQGAEAPEEEPILDRSLRRAMTASVTASAVLFNVGPLLLVLYSTSREVAVYSAAWRVAAGVLLLSTALATALLPSIMLARDPWREMRRLVRAGAGLSAALLVAALPLTVAGSLVVGEELRGEQEVLAVLLVAFALEAFALVTFGGYLRVRRPWVASTAALVQLAVFLVVSAGLSGEGALGLAVAQLGGVLAACAWLGAPLIAEARGSLRWFHDSPAGPVDPEAALLAGEEVVDSAR